MIKSLDDYVDVMVAKAKSRGYRVSRRCAKKLIQPLFKKFKKRLVQKNNYKLKALFFFFFERIDTTDLEMRSML